MKPRSPLPAKKIKPPRVATISLIGENMGVISDLSRALGLVEAVAETSKGERRQKVLEEAAALIRRRLPLP